MSDLAEKVEEIVKNFEIREDKSEQLAKLEEILEKLQDIIVLEKKSYNLPHVDTLGKNTFRYINTVK